MLVRIGSGAPQAAGPIGADPALVRAATGVGEPRLEWLATRRGRARALVTPLRMDGRTVGGAAAARLTGSESSALLERRIAVALAALVAFLAASAVAWFTLGRLLRPVREMAATADAIAAEGDLGRRVETGPRRDEVGTLARTLNRMLARLEAAFRREQRFIREASHELRTPITICRGHLEVLGDNPRPEEVRETVAVVVDELGRMGRIVDDMTTLARVEDPAFLRPEEIDLDAFLTEIGRAAEPLVAGRLTVEGGAGGATLRADRHRLAQALLNLLQNATVHGDSAGPVELRLVPEPGAWRFEVADQGGGLAEGEEERLFRPFARSGSRTPGSGLGLAIVRGIAEAHGGAAGVDNRPGVGATFWLRLPA